LRGDVAVGLETSARDEVYAWAPVDSADAEKVTMFPTASYGDIPIRDLIRATRSALDSLEPDVVVTTGFHLAESQAALQWALQRRRRTVLMTDTRREDRKRSSAMERLKSLLVPAFDCALAASSSSIDYLEALGMSRDRCYRPYDVVDNRHFGALSGPHQQPTERVLLAGSRMVARKNLAAVIRAFGSYRTAVPRGRRLVVFGDGPERRALEDLATRVAPGEVEFVGFRQYEELPSLYASAALFLHVPHTDPWGLVVNEAMAAGVPAIVSRQAGASELVRNGVNGWVCDQGDDDEILELLMRVGDDDEVLRSAGSAAQDTVERFSLDHFANALHSACVRATADPRRVDGLTRVAVRCLAVDARLGRIAVRGVTDE
jgi:glycosyltransferase involved in cell wall biosynthesis